MSAMSHELLKPHLKQAIAEVEEGLFGPSPLVLVHTREQVSAREQHEARARQDVLHHCQARGRPFGKSELQYTIDLCSTADNSLLCCVRIVKKFITVLIQKTSC